MTIRHDLTVNQGETWSFTYTHLDAAGSAVDLTGYSARMSVKPVVGGSLEAYLSTGSDANGGTITLGGAAGTVALAMTDAQTSDLAGAVRPFVTRVTGERVLPYVYDLEIESAGGTVTRVLEGAFRVNRGVTQ